MDQHHAALAPGNDQHRHGRSTCRHGGQRAASDGDTRGAPREVPHRAGSSTDRRIVSLLRVELMADPEPLIRNISDTAFWAAIYRARETEQPNPLFRDPFARRLAGTRG